MATLSLAFLGSFTVRYNGQVVAGFRTRSVQALLAYLVVEDAGTAPHQRDAVAELLWPGYPPGAARKNLRQTLYELGRLIPVVNTEGGAPAPLTLSSRETLQINPECEFELDTAAFTRLAEDGSEAALEKAAALYRGDFLNDFVLPDSAEFESWAAAWRGHFRREALDALDQLTVIGLRQGEFSQAESYARRQLALDDLRETAVGQLMQALAGQGQRSAALLAFEKARRRLDAELGIKPGESLEELWRQVRAGESLPALLESPAASSAQAAVRDASRPVHNLPAHATPFIGRKSELDEIRRLLAGEEQCRLLTLLGPGGSGKTRLSIQAAASFVESAGTAYPDGAWFVPLAQVQRPEELPYAIARALNFTFIAGDPAARQLTDYLRPRRQLLLLDNFEQLVGESSGAFLGGLLRDAPGITLLITSRSRLQLAGEFVFPVPGLDVPPERAPVDVDLLQDYEGVALFDAGARRVKPDFSLNAQNGPAVAAICRLVSGMPLAIELAASWAEQLEPAEIEAEIGRSFDFLETELYDVPLSQRSLRAVFATSWQMLTSEEKKVLFGLSYFAGTVGREAARQVAGAGLRQLQALLHKSWLTRGDEGRYSLHPLLCQFVAEVLWADPEAGREIAEAHHGFFLALAERLTHEMQGPGQAGALAQLTRNVPDMRLTWHDLVEQGRLEPVVNQLLPALFHHAEATSRSAGLALLLDDVLPRLPRDAGQHSRLRAILLTVRSAFDLTGIPLRFNTSGVVVPAFKEHAEEAWALADAGELGGWGPLLALVYGILVDRDAGLAAAHRVVEVTVRQAGRWEQAQALYFLGWLMVWNPTGRAEADSGMGRFREALALFQSVGDRRESGYTLRGLGYAAVFTRRYDDAVRYWTDAREELAAVGDQMGAAIIDWGLGDVCINLGKVEEGFGHFDHMRRIYESAGHLRLAGNALSKESFEAARYGTLEHARKTRRRALDLLRKVGAEFDEAWGMWEMGELYRLEGDSKSARQWYDQANAFFEQFDDPNFPSFYHRGLGELALAAGDAATALEHYTESHRSAKAAGHVWMEVIASDGLARTHLAAGDEAEAWRTWRLALKAAERWDDRVIIQLIGTGAALHTVYGDPIRALELGAYVVESPVTWNETRARAGEFLEQALAKIDAATAAAARERGRKLELETVLEEELSSKS